MSRYIPPALRNKCQSSCAPHQPPKRPATTFDSPSYTLDEIRNHYFPATTDFSPPSSQNSRTLHDSASTPGKLSHILLFKDANPRWETDGIIYTKSALNLLPAELASDSAPDDIAQSDSTENGVDSPVEPLIDVSTSSTVGKSPSTSPTTTYTPPHTTITSSTTDTSHSLTTTTSSPHRPIAVFTQTLASNHAHALFTFTGYYTITRLEFLAPHSPSLVRMLEQKWTVTRARSGQTFQKSRPKHDWDRSLGMTWAVAKLTKDRGAATRLGAPQIETLGRDVGSSEGKSVNDLLRAMRLGGRRGETTMMTTSNAGENRRRTEFASEATQEKLREPLRQPRGPVVASEGTWGGNRVTQAVDVAIATSASKAMGVNEATSQEQVAGVR